MGLHSMGTQLTASSGRAREVTIISADHLDVAVTHGRRGAAAGRTRREGGALLRDGSRTERSLLDSPKMRSRMSSRQF